MGGNEDTMDGVGLMLFLAGGILLVLQIIKAGQWAARRGEVGRRFTRKTSVVHQLLVLMTGMIYLFSFSRCGLSYLWLLLGVVATFSSLVGLISIPFVYRTSISKAYNEPSKAMKGYFVGRSAFGLIASVALLCLWAYSWRHLILQQ